LAVDDLGVHTQEDVDTVTSSPVTASGPAAAAGASPKEPGVRAPHYGNTVATCRDRATELLDQISQRPARDGRFGVSKRYNDPTYVAHLGRSRA
jgi:hypothetical protein